MFCFPWNIENRFVLSPIRSQHTCLQHTTYTGLQHTHCTVTACQLVELLWEWCFNSVLVWDWLQRISATLPYWYRTAKSLWSNALPLWLPTLNRYLQSILFGSLDTLIRKWLFISLVNKYEWHLSTLLQCFHLWLWTSQFSFFVLIAKLI